MSPFYIIFIFIALAAYSEVLPLSYRDRKYIVFFVVILLVVFSGCRFQIGAHDFEEYTNAYIDIVENGLDRKMYSSSALIFEPGFVFLLYVCSLFSSSPTWMMLVIAFISVGINIMCYKNYLPRFFLFAVLFYFIHTYLLRDMSLIRSGIGASIVLYSLRFIESGELKKFLGTIFVAMFFHLASITFIIVYPFYRFNWSRKIWIYIVLASLFVGIFFPLGHMLLNLPTHGALSRISNYSWMIGSSRLGVLSNPTTLKQLFFVLGSLIFYDKLMVKVPHFRVMLTPYILSVCWLMLWNDFAIVAGRMATFLSVTEVLIMPLPLLLVKKGSRPIVALTLIALAFTILYWNGNYYMANVPGLLPYRFAPIEI